MNEKLSRPQFNQMDTTEKQTLMESLAARYTMTFLDLHTFDRWGQSSTTGIFEKDGRKFVFVPGDTVTLGWEQFAVGYFFALFKASYACAAIMARITSSIRWATRQKSSAV